MPLIAELKASTRCGLVDATALPGAGHRRCRRLGFSPGRPALLGALRPICVQEDVADGMIAMISGAAAELKIGDPRDPAVHIGPVIDEDAKQRLEAHIAAMKKSARVHFSGIDPARMRHTMVSLSRHIFSELSHDVWSALEHWRSSARLPLRSVRYPRANELDRILDAIAATGYGLTLGIHSRIDETVERIIGRLNVGNCYVNRNMIGAVVGTQPFGGTGLSGTGPKGQRAREFYLKPLLH